MNLFEKLKLKKESYVESEEGTFGIMAAVTSLMMVLCVGVAVDVSSAHKSHLKVQALSDSIGLAAAIYIRDNEVAPSSSNDGFVDGIAYDINDIDHGSRSSALQGVFTVKYDDVNRQASVKFTGKMDTSFMSAFNKPVVDIAANSKVNYYTESASPTSVFLVVDNSGSMAWDDKPITSSAGRRPEGAKTRIEGLRSTSIKFNADLDKTFSTGNSVSNRTYLRMAMVPYASQIIESLKTPPAWKTLDDRKLEKMTASGGTDSRAPLELAEKWMAKEDNIHFAVSKVKNPKKYVIFMTDGANNSEQVCDWQDRRRTQLWRRANGSTYQYTRSRRNPGRGWTEGQASNCRWVNNSNIESLEVCGDLKELGVEIFTIGYALEPGNYYSNFPYSNATRTISKTTTDEAYGFLESCASSEENFVKAENTEALENAFEKISKKISDDSIRISG